MSKETQEEKIADAINVITQKLSDMLLKKFLELPEELQLNIILIKCSQLLLANILCHVASTHQELENVMAKQDKEITELTLNCAATGFPEKFHSHKH